jgi:Tfp pilus assembly protein PilO
VKISTTTIAFLLFGVLVIAAALLGVNYMNQVKEQSSLQSQILQTTKQINAIPVQGLRQQQADLNSQKTKINSQILVAKHSLMQSESAVNVIDDLYTIAGSSGIEVQKVNSAPATEQDLNQVPFSAVPITINVKGSVPDIIAYVQKVADKFPLSIIKPVEISVPPSTAGLAIQRLWSLESGALPPGLELDPLTGTISGIPDTVGTSDFTIKVSFSDDTSATKDFMVTINDHKINDNSLGDGELNVPYSKDVTTTGLVIDSSEIDIKDKTPTAVISMNIMSGKES